MRVSRTSMGWARPGMVAAVLVLASLAGCTVDQRSSSYRCDDPSDCSGGRVCQQGWCVVAGTPDAGTPSGCPASCESCIAGTCVIECEDAQDCADRVECPPGLDCDVTCTGSMRCSLGVDCSRADDCTVVCDGLGACAGGVICGTGECDVDCSGLGSCTQGIDCSGSCACDTECSNESGCGPRVCPGDGGACERSGECNSAGCNFC